MRRGLLGGHVRPDSPRTPRRRRGRRAARWRSREVLLVPARVPPHRRAPHASAAHRFAMAALAVQDRTGLSVSDLEMARRRAVLYVGDCSTGWRRRAPICRRLCFVTGADAFRDIETWKDYPAILDRCHFVVGLAAGLSGGQPAATRCRALASRMIDALRARQPRTAGDSSRGRADGAGVVDRRPAAHPGRASPSPDLVPAAVAAYIAATRALSHFARQDQA